MTQAAPVHLVDASLYVFRAWHSLPSDVFDVDGHPVNAVHGFTRFLLELVERTGATHIAIAFDEALTSCFRNALYPAIRAVSWPASAHQSLATTAKSKSRLSAPARGGERSSVSITPFQSAAPSGSPLAQPNRAPTSTLSRPGRASAGHAR